MTDWLFSSDCHVVEPLDLWNERLPANLRDRAPRRERRDGGGWNIVVHVGGRDVRAMTFEAENFEHDDDQPGAGSGYEPEERMKDLRADGLSGEVLYPTMGNFGWSMPEPDIGAAYAAVYNDWLAETFATKPDFFVCPGMVPVHDLDLAIAEVERIGKLGLHGAMLPLTAPEGRPYHLPEYERLWDALDALGLPVSAHIVTGMPARALAASSVHREKAPPISLFGEIRGAAPAQVMLHDLVVAGVLERHPNLHFVMVESGIAWLAWLMESMDSIYQRAPMRRARRAAKLSLLPSEYVKRQCHATFMNDPMGVANRGITGIEALLWGNDYPHPEGTYPNSVEKVKELFAGVPEDERRAMTELTAASLWGFPPQGTA